MLAWTPYCISQYESALVRASCALSSASCIPLKAWAAWSSAFAHSRVGFCSALMSLHHLVGDTFSGVGVAPRDGVQREHLSGEAGQVVLGGEPYAPEQGDDLLPSRVEQGGVELHGFLSQPGPFPALYLYASIVFTMLDQRPPEGTIPG